MLVEGNLLQDAATWLLFCVQEPRVSNGLHLEWSVWQNTASRVLMPSKGPHGEAINFRSPSQNKRHNVQPLKLRSWSNVGFMESAVLIFSSWVSKTAWLGIYGISYRRGWGRILLAKYAKHLCDLLQQRREIHPTQSELRRNPGARKAQSSEWQMESGKSVNSQGGSYCQPVVVTDLPLDRTPRTVLYVTQWDDKIW